MKRTKLSALFMILLACIMLFDTTMITSAAITFADVSSGEFYYEPVQWAVEKRITTGYSPEIFAPNDTCTRGQIVTQLWRAAGMPEVTATDCSFKDVSVEQYYYDAIRWAAGIGITSGYSTEIFAPDDICTRGQIVTFLWRYMGMVKPTSDRHSFTDIGTGAYYYEAVLWAVEKGITTGLTDAQFGPDAWCTRGQTVTFLYRALSTKTAVLPVIEAKMQDAPVRPTVKEGGNSNSIPEIVITPNIGEYFMVKSVSIKHENAAKPYVYIPTKGFGTQSGVFWGIDMGDGTYTYVLSMYNVSANIGGSEVIILRLINGVLTPVTELRYNSRTDNIRVDGRIDGAILKGIIYPTKTEFHAVFDQAYTDRNGVIREDGCGTIKYEKNGNGSYDLIFSTSEYSNWTHADRIGGSRTRYVLRGGDVVIGEQWYEVY